MTDHQQDTWYADVRVKHKPCPFCGGQPTILDYHSGYFVTGCLACGCETFSHGDDEKAAWEQWNRRVSA